MKMKMLKNIMLVLVIMGLLGVIVNATPYGPGDLGVADTDTRTAGTSSTTGWLVNAEKGNVTELTIDQTKITNYWQGYYGNITGSITLDNANNQTMYDWSFPNPRGEVYAANQTVASWTEVRCINLTYNRPGYNCSSTEAEGLDAECLNITEIEDHFGMSITDSDGVNETFNSTADITVGTTTLTDCPAAHLYVNSTFQEQYWNETLITVNNTGTIIFASIIEDNYFGFDNNTWDFQMIVGTVSSDVTTPYYFYVELS